MTRKRLVKWLDDRVCVAGEATFHIENSIELLGMPTSYDVKIITPIRERYLGGDYDSLADARRAIRRFVYPVEPEQRGAGPCRVLVANGVAIG